MARFGVKFKPLTYIKWHKYLQHNWMLMHYAFSTFNNKFICHCQCSKGAFIYLHILSMILKANVKWEIINLLNKLITLQVDAIFIFKLSYSWANTLLHFPIQCSYTYIYIFSSITNLAPSPTINSFLSSWILLKKFNSEVEVQFVSHSELHAGQWQIIYIF